LRKIRRKNTKASCEIYFEIELSVCVCDFVLRKKKHKNWQQEQLHFERELQNCDKISPENK